MKRIIPAGLLALLIWQTAHAQPGDRQLPNFPPKAVFEPPDIGVRGRLGPKMLVEDTPYSLDIRKYLEAMIQAKSLDPKQTMDPAQLKSILEKMPNGKDLDKDRLQQLQKQFPQLQDPQFMQLLEKMMQNEAFMKNLKDQMSKQGAVSEQDLQNKLKMLDNLKGMNSLDPTKIGKGDGMNFTPPKIDSNLSTNPTLNPQQQQIMNSELMKWMQRNFADSPAAKDAIDRLANALSKNDKMVNMFDKIPEFKNGAWKDINKWGKTNASGLWDLKLPDIKPGSTGNFSTGGGGSSGFSLFGGSGGGGSSDFGSGGFSGGGATSSLAILAGIVGAIFLAWFYFRRYQEQQLLKQAEALALANRTGIDLNGVDNREKLVAAFDALSLKKCGEESRTWNHGAIRDQIAETEPVHEQPATELAELYQKARYAPEHEELEPVDYDHARNDLKTIAGSTTL